MKLERLGRDAMLVSDIDEPAVWAYQIRPLVADDVHDVVPGEADVVVIVRPGSFDVVAGRLDDHMADGPIVAGRLDELADVTIEVDFDGPDLPEVAERTGLTVDDVVDRIVARPLRVAFCGFSPGFAYLTGLTDELHLERRPSPRRSVPAGSFAIAAGYAAVYPSPSPGGWHLLGSTDLTVWDVSREPPALLAPGTRVDITRR